jgi:hypothetical protein
VAVARPSLVRHGEQLKHQIERQGRHELEILEAILPRVDRVERAQGAR